ncbi:dTDP-4-dehydrorhamnose 3,5-epimerase [soil metagenome]
MKVTKTEFRDLLILEPYIFPDDRGFFFEAFNRNTMEKEGLGLTFVQDNESYSKKNVLRGLHFQRHPFAQTKLVRVVAGAIRDVVVDLRKNEPTYSQHFAISLSSENKKQLFVPKGFAHGFIVLSETAEVIYKSDEYYRPESEGGILYSDPRLGIDWEVSASQIIVSNKDMINPLLVNAVFDF